MGAVGAAEQTEPIKRRVALKLIKPGMDSTQVLRRFEAERQALAMMDHTHIAKVLDAGTTPEGRPYFVLTDGPGFNGFPVASPDGLYVAYVHFDRPILQADEGGKLMLYDLETLTHTPITPEGMRCAKSKIVWKPMGSEVDADAGGQSNTRK